MKKWHLVVLAALFMGLGSVAFAYGPLSGDGVPPFAGSRGGFRGPFAGSEGAPGPGSFRPGFGPGFGPGFQGGVSPGRYLNLSEEQLTKMGAVRDRIYGETKDLRYALAQQQLEVRRLFTDPKTDDTTLLTKQKEMITLREQLFSKMAQTSLEMRKILTPEQIQKLDRMPMGQAGMGLSRMGFGGPGRGTW
jgi:Spy/CpxP family protein refolding chaperone